MRISDWSSDVCSSDLDRSLADAPEGGGPIRAGHARLHAQPRQGARGHEDDGAFARGEEDREGTGDLRSAVGEAPGGARLRKDRKSVVSGKSVALRLEFGGCRYLQKKNHHKSFF